MRIEGVNIPDRKRAQIALTYIYGIGKSRATAILNQAEVSVDTVIEKLTEEEAGAFARLFRMGDGLKGISAKRCS